MVQSHLAAPLENHPGWVDALTALPAGRLASASSDKTIRLCPRSAKPSPAWRVDVAASCPAVLPATTTRAHDPKQTSRAISMQSYPLPWRQRGKKCAEAQLRIAALVSMLLLLPS